MQTIKSVGISYLIVFTFFAFIGYGFKIVSKQKKIVEEGIITWAVTTRMGDVTSESKAITVFKKNNKREETLSGIGVNFITITKENKNICFLYEDGYGSKIAAEAAPSQLSADENSNFSGFNKLPKYKLDYTKETKEIAGYPCKKAVIRFEDGSSGTLYYTDRLMVYNKELNVCPEIKQLVLAYEIPLKRGNLRYTVVKIEIKETDNTLFEIPPDYKMVSYPEFQKIISQPLYVK